MKLQDYSTSDFTLTENEEKFIHTFISNNGCGARTPEEILEDNFSCQCIEDLRDIYPNLTSNQIGGYLSSLQSKGVIILDDRDGPICLDNAKRFIFEPDLYWVSEDYLSSLDSNLDFYSELETL